MVKGKQTRQGNHTTRATRTVFTVIVTLFLSLLLSGCPELCTAAVGARSLANSLVTRYENAYNDLLSQLSTVCPSVSCNEGTGANDGTSTDDSPDMTGAVCSTLCDTFNAVENRLHRARRMLSRAETILALCSTQSATHDKASLIAANRKELQRCRDELRELEGFIDAYEHGTHGVRNTHDHVQQMRR